jgi:hypothetical protein
MPRRCWIASSALPASYPLNAGQEQVLLLLEPGVVAVLFNPQLLELRLSGGRPGSQPLAAAHSHAGVALDAEIGRWCGSPRGPEPLG